MSKKLKSTPPWGFRNLPKPCQWSANRLPWLGCLVTCLVFTIETAAQDAPNPLASLIFESIPMEQSQPGEVNASAPDISSGQDAGTIQAENPIEEAGTSSGIDTYLAAIQESIDSGGQFSPLLSEQYEALGVLQFREGNLEEAAEAFDNAIHIHKVNKGLFNLDQARLVHHLIDVYTALGDFPSVDNYEHYLYYIQDKSLAEGDPRLMAARLAWADWNLEAYTKGYREGFTSPVSMQDSIDATRGLTYRTVHFPFRINIENSPDGSTETREFSVSANMPVLNSNAVATNAAVTDYTLRNIPFALSSDLVINERLYEAEHVYESLLENLEKNNPGDLEEQQKIQYKLANVDFLLKKEVDQYKIIRDRRSIANNRVNKQYTNDSELYTARRYVNISKDVSELVEKIEASPDSTTMDKANAWLALGDLHLSFERPQRAHAAYHKAYELLADAEYTDDEAARLLVPEPDIPVPVYGTHPYSRGFFGIDEDVDIPFRGYIDIAYDKDRYGKINGINVLGSSGETPARVQTALVNYLRNGLFRPAISEGEIVNQDDIQQRYYYYFQ